MATTSSTFQEDVEDVLANDHHGIVLARHRFTRDGQLQEYRTVHVYEIRDVSWLRAGSIRAIKPLSTPRGDRVLSRCGSNDCSQDRGRSYGPSGNYTGAVPFAGQFPETTYRELALRYPHFPQGVNFGGCDDPLGNLAGHIPEGICRKYNLFHVANHVCGHPMLCSGNPAIRRAES